MGAETHDVDLSHSGRKIARKSGESKGGLYRLSRELEKMKKFRKAVRGWVTPSLRQGFVLDYGRGPPSLEQ